MYCKYKTERFQAVQESAQYRVVELVQTIGGQRKCFYSEFHALSDHQKTVIGNLDQYWFISSQSKV